VASDKTLPMFGSCHLSRVTRHARSQQDTRKTIEEKEICRTDQSKQIFVSERIFVAVDLQRA
jgi:hypothetical protein